MRARDASSLVSESVYMCVSLSLCVDISVWPSESIALRKVRIHTGERGLRRRQR